MKKAIIVGASSGIGRELAILFADNNWSVMAGARRTDLLKELEESHEKISAFPIDVSKPDAAITLLSEILDGQETTDLLVISAGTGDINKELIFECESRTIATNVAGFTAIADCAFNHFIQQGHGHLVGISSIASIRGGWAAPAYNASKAYQSNYLEGLRQKANKVKASITVTEVIPGFVDTTMAKGEGIFWMAPVKTAALQMYRAIERKKRKVYITKRWGLIAWILRNLPDFIYEKL